MIRLCSASAGAAQESERSEQYVTAAAVPGAITAAGDRSLNDRLAVARAALRASDAAPAAVFVIVAAVIIQFRVIDGYVGLLAAIRAIITVAYILTAFFTIHKIHPNNVEISDQRIGSPKRFCNVETVYVT